VLLPQAMEFGGGILADFFLNVLDVALIEFGRFAILEDHQVQVFIRSQGETGEHFQRRTGDAALVGTRVFEQDDLALFEVKASLLCEEQVCTLDDVAEVWLALGINESGDIGDVDCFRAARAEAVSGFLRPMVKRLPSTARNE
jgi:hypothetical protein